VWCRYREIEEVFWLFKKLSQRTEPYVIRYLRRRIGEGQLPRMQDNSVDDVCIFSAMDLVEESLNRNESAVDKISASLDNFTLSVEKIKLCI